MTRNLSKIQTVLFDELDLIVEGNSTPAKTNAIARTSKVLLESAKFKIELDKIGASGDNLFR